MSQELLNGTILAHDRDAALSCFERFVANVKPGSRITTVSNVFVVLGTEEHGFVRVQNSNGEEYEIEVNPYFFPERTNGEHVDAIRFTSLSMLNTSFSTNHVEVRPPTPA